MKGYYYMKKIKYAATFAMVTIGVYLLIGYESCTKNHHHEFDHGAMTEAEFRLHHEDFCKSIHMSSLSDKENIIPIAVIGSGPSGLSAGMYGARSKHTTVVFEGDKPGGLLMDTTMVENWPGSPPTMGPDIIQGLRDQAERSGALFFSETISEIDFSAWPYTLKTDDGQTYNALSVVIATGAKPRKLGVPGEEEFWGHGVTSCALCDGPFYRNEEVVVVGGGDSAVEEAIQLAPYAKKITVLVRKNRMRAAASMQDRLQNYPHISIKYHVQISRIVGNEEDGVMGVELYNEKTQQLEMYPAKGIFLAIGHEPNSQIFAGQLDMTHAGYITIFGKSQSTSVPGVFAGGEVVDKVYRQAGVAAGDGIKAALDAISFLNDIGYDLQMAQKYKQQLVQEGEDRNKNSIEVPLITDFDAFQTILAENADKTIFIDFFAEYCSSCMAMLPSYAAVAQEFGNRALFFKVDVGAHMELADKFHVSKVPCLLVFKEGTLHARFTSAMSRQELFDFVPHMIEGVE